VNARVLVVDDDLSMCELLEARLTKRGFDVVTTTNPLEAAETVNAAIDGQFDVVVTDLNMRGLNGIGLCERIATNWPQVPVIVITAFGSLESAVEAIRAGAYDFITKPLQIEELAHTLGRALQHRALQQEVKRLRLAASEAEALEGVIGESPTIRSMSELVSRAAEADASVLITGESGTGKELVARAIHRRSRRCTGPLVGINCAAMPATLLESELFGHVRGAFTDATASRRGLFVEASGGTLLLDEIGELPLELQPKLLRAIQERTVRPVGGTSEVSFDARIVSTTNKDLESAVEDERFREDLYFRLNVIHVQVAPLRTRGKDILLLAQHFLDRFAQQSGKSVTGLSSGAASKLLDYTWPGNVRELQNCMERAVALTRTQEILVDDLPERIRKYRVTDMLIPGNDPSELVSIEEVERRYILHVLEVVGGNKALAARILQLDRKTLYRKLERYGISSDA
jgi:two-component system response regulator HydG